MGLVAVLLSLFFIVPRLIFRFLRWVFTSEASSKSTAKAKSTSKESPNPPPNPSRNSPQSPSPRPPLDSLPKLLLCQPPLNSPSKPPTKPPPKPPSRPPPKPPLEPPSRPLPELPSEPPYRPLLKLPCKPPVKLAPNPPTETPSASPSTKIPSAIISNEMHSKTQPKPFLMLPGEIRNHIYSYLTPAHTAPANCTGIVHSCKQIKAELEPLLLASANRLLTHVNHECSPKGSEFRGRAFTERWSGPLAPYLTSFPQLSHIILRVPFRLPQRHRTRLFSQGNIFKPSLGETVPPAAPLFGLEIPYLTLRFEAPERTCEYNFVAAQSQLMHSFDLFHAIKKRVEVRAKNVIFDWSYVTYGPLRESEQYTYAVFVRRARAPSTLRYEMLSCETESWRGDDEVEREEILRKSREIQNVFA